MRIEFEKEARKKILFASGFDHQDYVMKVYRKNSAE